MNIYTERESVMELSDFEKVSSPYSNMKKMGKGVLPLLQNHLNYFEWSLVAFGLIWKRCISLVINRYDF